MLVSSLRNFVWNTVLLSCILSYIYGRYQLKYNIILYYYFAFQFYQLFHDKIQNQKTTLLTTYYSRKWHVCILHIFLFQKTYYWQRYILPYHAHRMYYNSGLLLLHFSSLSRSTGSMYGICTCTCTISN